PLLTWQIEHNNPPFPIPTSLPLFDRIHTARRRESAFRGDCYHGSSALFFAGDQSRTVQAAQARANFVSVFPCLKRFGDVSECRTRQFIEVPKQKLQQGLSAAGRLHKQAWYKWHQTFDMKCTERAGRVQAKEETNVGPQGGNTRLGRVWLVKLPCLPLPSILVTLPTELFVDGAWRSSACGRRLTLINPANEEAFAEVAAADAADVNVAVESAQRAWESGWRALTPGKRTEVLFSVARKLREQSEETAQLETLQIGKPIGDARDEAALGARVFEYYAGAVSKFCGQTIPVARGGFDFTLRQPMGVVAAV